MIRNSQLHQLAIAAVSALGERLDQHFATGAGVPGIHIPQLTFDSHGWPQITTNRWDGEARRDNPVAVFGPNASESSPLAWSDVPELTAFVEYVLSDADIAAQVTIPMEAFTVLGKDPERLSVFARHSVIDLPMSILARARAVGIDTVEFLDELYETCERAWLAEALPIEYFIPLVLTSFDTTDTLPLADNIRIEHISDAFHLERGRHPSVGAGVSQGVVDAATHALVIAAPDITNHGPAGRFRSDKPFDPNFGQVIAEADRACEALRIVRPHHVGYASVFVRPLGWADHWTLDLPPLVPIDTLRRYAIRFDSWRARPKAGEASFDANDVARAANAFSALKSGPNVVRLAARRLTLAANRDDEDDQAVDACIGFEALMGDDNTELTHRLCQRAAAVLATRAHEPRDPVAVYKVMKHIYKHRSLVVHGSSPDKYRTFTCDDGVKVPTASIAVTLLREVLLERLERPGGWSPAGLDSIILQHLTPSPPQ
jgi:hypothetical protein